MLSLVEKLNIEHKDRGSIVRLLGVESARKYPFPMWGQGGTCCTEIATDSTRGEVEDHSIIGYLAEGKDALIDSALDGTSREPKVDILAGFEWPRVWKQHSLPINHIDGLCQTEDCVYTDFLRASSKARVPVRRDALRSCTTRNSQPRLLCLTY